MLRIWSLELMLLSSACVQPSTITEPTPPEPLPSESVQDRSTMESASTSNTETVDDPCAAHDGLVLSPPAAITADWQGAVTQGGTGTLGISWCGEGAVTVRKVTVRRVDTEQTTEQTVMIHESSPERRLVPQQTITVELHAPAAVGTLGVVVNAEGDDGREHVARTTVAALDDPERTAQRKACLDAGGSWGPRGLLGLEACDRPTKDAGKRCLSDAECEGACLDDGDEPVAGQLPAGVGQPPCTTGQQPRLLVGRCDTKVLRFGCHARLRTVRVECVAPDMGRRKRMVCVD